QSGVVRTRITPLLSERTAGSIHIHRFCAGLSDFLRTFVCSSTIYILKLNLIPPCSLVMARPTSPCSSEFDTKLDLWTQLQASEESEPSASTSAITLETANQPVDTHERIKRSSSTEETSTLTNRVKPTKSLEKRAREPEEDEEKLDKKIKPGFSKSPRPHDDPSTNSPDNNPPVPAPKSKAPGIQSLGNLTCAICLSSPSPAAVTKCGHVVCGECLASSIVSQHNSSFGSFPPFMQPAGTQINNGQCPVCRAALVGGWGTAMRGAIFKIGNPS
ncbi:hypothetical protein PSHT_02568, partial [Puccinia striiformis]